MAIKDNFTPEEWNILLRTPMLVSYAVAGSAPSKEEDFTREMSAVADAVIEGGQKTGQDSLLAAVVADIIANAQDEKRGQTEKLSVGDAQGRTYESCRAAAALLRAKASPEEAQEYKNWVVRVAHSVASAAKEGGFLGFGGAQVSGGEIESINKIGEALEV
jgi:hypothetical protein